MKKTIQDEINEKVNKYEKIYKSLVEVGNKKPASVTLREARLNELFISEQVIEQLKKKFSKIKEQEQKGEKTK